MSSKVSASAMTAQTAITRMSISLCVILPGQRGSSSATKCAMRVWIMAGPPLARKAQHAISSNGHQDPFHAFALAIRPCLTGSYDLGLNETMSVTVGLAHLQHDQEGAQWTAA